MISVERVRIPAGYRLIDHRHASAHLLIVLSGEVWEDGEAYTPGDIRVSTARDRHFLAFPRDTECAVLAGELPAPSCGVRRVVRRAELAEELPIDAPDDRLLDFVHTPALADFLCAEPPAWLAEVEDTRRRGRLLHTRHIAEVARLAGVSREHLARSYRRYFGTSLTEAIKARRLHDAWDAVTGSATPLADVAHTIGFADQSHMTRHFAEWIGFGPAAARRTAEEVTRLQDGSLGLDA